MNKSQGQKTTKIGVVIGNNMKKTITVLSERRIKHPFYKKIVKRRKKFLAHDEYEKCKIGDVVKIVETRPLSRRKRWRIQEIVELSPSEREEENEDKK
ncbi:MAG: 30S ribosomal protein S17 [Candidatus Aminicenantes bacterium]|nr:MAG: 30S ribosomal protein S17 [Candidatus Aminicenantes bacterium]